MILLDKINKIYSDASTARDFIALDDVSFSIKPGEFVSIVGPSGCGKTTVINHIAGFIEPSAGTILFDGQPVENVSPERIVVFQEHNLFEWKTVYGNIEFGLKAGKVPKETRKEIVSELIKKVHLQGFEDYYPYQLSGGMKQRTALARALAVDPGCILMDEPLGSLDPQIREKLQVEIAELWEQTSKTVLMVTHDVEEAIFMSSRVLIMSAAPSRIVREYNIDLAYPRGPEMKLSDDFLNIKRSILSEFSSLQGDPDE